MLCLFMCNVLSSETYVLRVLEICLKVLQGSQNLASRYHVIIVFLCFSLCCYNSLFFYYFIYSIYFVTLCYIILCFIV